VYTCPHSTCQLSLTVQLLPFPTTLYYPNFLPYNNLRVHLNTCYPYSNCTPYRFRFVHFSLLIAVLALLTSLCPLILIHTYFLVSSVSSYIGTNCFDTIPIWVYTVHNGKADFLRVGLPCLSWTWLLAIITCSHAYTFPMFSQSVCCCITVYVV
jgi:hypothetical protein